ncbi:MAG: FeoB small GTPase domain-containing protein [Candidatus Heteroscillospira sp.]|jgi:ferrous iron transport protein B
MTESTQRLIALGGNPNVGKSTIFNSLTGMRQHTGNWSGKTVGCAFGRCCLPDGELTFADLPGTYSLCASSAEEALARDFICFGGAEQVCIVCDGGCLSRGLALTLQVMEAHPRVTLCVNLLDEAEKLGLQPNLTVLSQELGIPVCGASAARGQGIDGLLQALDAPYKSTGGQSVKYSGDIEAAIAACLKALGKSLPDGCARFAALCLLRGDRDAVQSISEHLKLPRPLLDEAAAAGRRLLSSPETIDDRIAASLSARARELEALCCQAGRERTRGIDRFLTHPILGLPAMALLLGAVLWLTIVGANYPSALLSRALFSLGGLLEGFLSFLPAWARSALFDGVWRTSAWVTAVMLPPMAIFFPLFTLLEDMGYLPRVAFNLDYFFQKAHGSGKQALTMCSVSQRMPKGRVHTERGPFENVCVLILPGRPCGPGRWP